MNIKSLVSFLTKLSKRERIIFYATVAVIGLVFLDRFILTPILVKIAELSDTIQIKENEIQQSFLIMSQEGRVKKEEKLYHSYLSEITSEEKDITSFLREVEGVAKESAVYLVDVKPSNKLEDKTSKQYFVRLNFEAQMEQVMNFFYHISTFEELIKIQDFQIKPKTEGSTIISCTMSLSKTIIPE